MKSKLLYALAVVLIVSILLSTYAAFAAATPKASNEKPTESQKIYHSFSLATSGTAINDADEVVGVSLLIQGNANGKLKTVFHLHTQNGDSIIEGYDAISAVRGQGIVVNKNNFIHLSIMMSSDNYGGRSTLWVLRGTTAALTDDTMPVSLQGSRVVLPIEGYPQLTDLTLDGTITLQ